MRSKVEVISFAVIGLLVISVPLFAHHGYVAYDTDKKVTLKGTVTRWLWSNPHCLLQLDVTDDGLVVVDFGKDFAAAKEAPARQKVKAQPLMHSAQRVGLARGIGHQPDVGHPAAVDPLL